MFINRLISNVLGLSLNIFRVVRLLLCLKTKICFRYKYFSVVNSFRYLIVTVHIFAVLNNIG